MTNFAAFFEIQLRSEDTSSNEKCDECFAYFVIDFAYCQPLIVDWMTVTQKVVTEKKTSEKKLFETFRISKYKSKKLP